MVTQYYIYQPQTQHYMFNDTIITGTTPITFVRRTPKGARAIFVPSGDTPQDERRLEIAHDVSATKKVSSLVKVSRTRPNPVTEVLEEGSVQLKLVHPASFTEAEMQLLTNQLVVFLSTGNIARLFNQES